MLKKLNKYKKIILLFSVSMIWFGKGQLYASDYVLDRYDTLKNKRKEWMNFGLGISSQKYFHGIGGLNAAGSFNFMPKIIDYQVGFNTTFSPFGSSSGLNVLNLSVGPCRSSKYYLVGVVLGPALMWGRDREENNFAQPGLSICCQLIPRVKNLGLGCELYVNLNNVQNSSGLRIVIHLDNN